ncbi:uncharacterized protein LOC116679498, partial [Etheostoma spectabile]|uniref:uncharacterized protein LOC116679498 n=1 Tax=Etheostoma spectabile TaxID=54343 RepID=UPI0013AF21C6
KNPPQNIYSLYNQVGINCFIAAGVYVAVGAVSLCQVRLNKRQEYMGPPQCRRATESFTSCYLLSTKKQSVEEEKKKMSLKVLEAKWKPALSSILEELTEPDFRKLLYSLVKIPQGLKTGRTREEIPDLIVQHYGTEGSISEIDKIMKKIPRNDAAVQEQLRPFVENLKMHQGKKGTTRKLSIDFGSVGEKQKLTADQLKSCPPVQVDPVGDVETEKKTEDRDLSLKPAESMASPSTSTWMTPKNLCPSEEGLSPAVQTGRIKIFVITKSDKTNTHLVVEFNGRLQTVFVRTRLLANAFGLEVDDGFERRYRYQMPLTAEASFMGIKLQRLKR